MNDEFKIQECSLDEELNDSPVHKSNSMPVQTISSQDTLLNSPSPILSIKKDNVTDIKVNDQEKLAVKIIRSSDIEA